MNLMTMNVSHSKPGFVIVKPADIGPIRGRRFQPIPREAELPIPAGCGWIDAAEEHKRHLGADWIIVANQDSDAFAIFDGSACAVGDAKVEHLTGGSICAAVDSYIHRIIVFVRPDGSVDVRAPFLDWEWTDGPDCRVDPLGQVKLQEIPLDFDGRPRKMQPAAEYISMDPTKAAAEIAADFDRLCNRHLPSPLVSGLDDPRLAIEPLTFKTGSADLLTSRIRDIIAAHLVWDRWPIDATVVPSLTAIPRLSDIRLYDDDDGYTDEDAQTFIVPKEYSWHDEFTAELALQAAFKENRGEGKRDGLYGDIPLRPLELDEWIRYPADITVRVELHSAHQRLEAKARLEDGFQDESR